MMSSKEDQHLGKSYFALVAGGCASAASFFGKLSGEIDAASNLNIWIVRATCIGLMLLCNAMVWTFFVKALHSKGGTLRATVMSAATNYFLSYILGILVFHEEITSLKALGISLILAGLLLIVKEETVIEDTRKKD
ncbi:unnamed protein product [Hermetia illucens]|uniref:EamA domain-containing protein n=1 Tax=Hermetia illucens TaxID=343691 RepID=A0A7R8YR54_HERIL|nr:uncharacterized protein LOC119648759 [Hermetia illucens]CAD7081135.1 unnamed protein product [Hermetia illucens]